MRDMMYGLGLVFVVGTVMYALDIQREALHKFIFLAHSSVPYIFVGAMLGLLENIRRNNSRITLILTEILKHLKND